MLWGSAGMESWLGVPASAAAPLSLRGWLSRLPSPSASPHRHGHASQPSNDPASSKWSVRLAVTEPFAWESGLARGSTGGRVHGHGGRRLCLPPVRTLWYCCATSVVLALVLLCYLVPTVRAAQSDSPSPARCRPPSSETDALVLFFHYLGGAQWRKSNHWGRGNPCGEGPRDARNWIGVLCGPCENGVRHVEVLALEWNNLSGELGNFMAGLPHLQVSLSFSLLLFFSLSFSFAFFLPFSFSLSYSFSLSFSVLPAAPLPPLSGIPSCFVFPFCVLSRSSLSPFPNWAWTLVVCCVVCWCAVLCHDYHHVSTCVHACLVCCAVLRGAMLCCAEGCCAVLCCAVRCCAVPRCAVLCCAVLCGAVLCHDCYHISTRVRACLTLLTRCPAVSVPSVADSQVLNLGTNALRGELPSAMGALSELRVLKLSYNRLSGRYPKSLYAAGQLELLDLPYNDLLGDLNEIFAAYPRLQILNLRGNRGFSGDIGALEAPLRAMPRLRVLDLQWNHIGGALPAALFSLPALQELSLTNNDISGSLPPAMRAPQLRVLQLADNYLEGTLPQALASLVGLRQLDLERNDIEGSLPEEIGMLTQLRELKLRNNRLTGGQSLSPSLSLSLCLSLYIYIAALHVSLLFSFQVPSPSLQSQVGCPRACLLSRT